MVHFTEQSPVVGGGTLDFRYTYTLDWGTLKWTSEQVIAD